MRSLLPILCAAVLAAGDAPPAPLVELNILPLAAPGGRWEPRERVLLLAPRFWALAAPNWIDHISTGFDEHLPRIGLRLQQNDCPQTAGYPQLQANLLQSFEPTVAVVMPGIVEAIWLGKGKAPEPPAFANELRNLVRRMQDATVVVLATAPPMAGAPAADDPIEALLEGYAEQVRLVAAELGCGLCDLRQAFAAAAGKPLHEAERNRLNGDGHRLAANVLAAALGRAMAEAPFELEVEGGVFPDQADIPIRLRRCPDPKQVSIRYTLDGSEPSASSRAYDRPFHVAQTCQLKVLATSRDGKVTRRAAVQLTKGKYRPADRPGRPAPGLRYAWYAQPARPTALPDFAALTPQAEGVCPWFDLDLQADNKDIPQMRRDFAVAWRGFLDIPADGVWTFHLRSDDGSRLLIGEDVVVNHDGNHNAETSAGGQACLRKGAHAFSLLYFQRDGGQSVALEYEGPGVRRQTLPQAALSHDASEKPKPKPKAKPEPAKDRRP